MQSDKKLGAIRKRLGREEFSKGDEVIFFCPRASCKGHHKPKLSVNLSTDKFHCWVCDWSGGNLVRLMVPGSPEQLEYIKELEGGREVRKEEQEKEYETPVLPEEFMSLSRPSRSPNYHGAMEYLAGRGITSEDIRVWKIGYCEEGEYRNRIILPSFDEHGDLNFFVGRTFYRDFPNYKHGNFSKNIVFNDYMVDWTTPIVVTEGPFDAIKAGENSLALHGSILREGSALFQKIVSRGVDVYFAMDTDAFKKQLEIIKLFLLYDVRSFYVSLGGKKDVGCMEKQEFQERKRAAVRVRNDLDLLRLRICA